jgi:hypothetical protein
MNALGALILSLLLIVVLCASRRWALLAIIAGMLFLTEEQALSILGFNLYALRFIELAGVIRIIARQEFSRSEFNRLDQAFVLLYAYTTIVFLIRSSEDQANQIGYAVDALFCYFTFRGLLKDTADLRWFLARFVVLLVPYTMLVLTESFTGHNPFSVVGGLDGYGGTWVRAGRVRCFGSFRHPTLMGTVGASSLPLYIGLWFGKCERRLAAIGIALCLAIVWASNSGGATSCVAAALVGWMLWAMRTRMRLFRRGLVFMIIVAAIVMKAPIWYLLERVSNVTGGDGWHRSYILDVAFQDIGKWWLAGMSLKETTTWFPNGGLLPAYGVADVADNYVLLGLTAGLGALILFITVLSRAFIAVGNALSTLRSNDSATVNTQFLYWGLGVVVAVHVVNWFGTSYFDQIYALWFMHLASASICIREMAAGEAARSPHVHSSSNMRWAPSTI